MGAPPSGDGVVICAGLCGDASLSREEEGWLCNKRMSGSHEGDDESQLTVLAVDRRHCSICSGSEYLNSSAIRWFSSLLRIRIIFGVPSIDTRSSSGNKPLLTRLSVPGLNSIELDTSGIALNSDLRSRRPREAGAGALTRSNWEIVVEGRDSATDRGEPRGR